MNDRFEIVDGDVSIRGGRIEAIAPSIPDHHDRVVEAHGGYVLPGLIQTHLHLCQTLFRGYADDLSLMDWLRRRIWPMEAAHTPASLRAATRLATTELLCSGTTTVLTMETVHDTDAVFEAALESGIRATIGKCMMDAAAHAPRRLQEDTRESIDDSVALRRRWHGAGGGRMRAAFAPRFAVSCSRELLEEVARLSAHDDALVHTHASESRDEIAIVESISGWSVEHRLPRAPATCVAPSLRRALRLGGRPRAGAASRARCESDALPRLEPEARIGNRARAGAAGPRDHGVARRRRRRVQQPARHVRGDAARRPAAVGTPAARRTHGARGDDDGDSSRRADAGALG